MGSKFKPGDRVRVRQAETRSHVRTPGYVRGKTGIVVAALGDFRNPEQLAYGADGLPKLALYRIGFRQLDLWPDYAGAERDTAVVEIYEPWLEPAAASLRSHTR